MALASYLPRSDYVGAGNLAAYTFNFKITAKDQLLVVCSNANFIEQFNVRGTDVVSLSSVVFDAVAGGGTVTLAANLPTGYHLALILAEDSPVQPSEFQNKGSSTLARLEAAYDRLGSQIQRLSYMAKRSIQIPDTILDSEGFDNVIPQRTTDVTIKDNSSKILTIGSDNKSIGIDTYSVADVLALITALQAAVASLASGGGGGSGLPIGGALGEFLEKNSATNDDASWKNATYVGVGRFGAWNTVGLKATLDLLVNLTRQLPTIVLTMAGGSGTVREKGTSVASSLMTATITQGSDPIAAARFYQGATLLSTTTANPPVPSGGAPTYTYASAFTNTISFTAQVDDDGSTNSGTPSTVISNTVTWTFIYPYYWGPAAAGLAAGSVAGTLTKVVANKPSALSFVAPGGGVYYVVIPVASGAYTSIKDSLGFETISDWTRTTISITGLDATAQNYYRYEFNNVVIAGTYPYTFI